jgi:hypothetical protein
MPALEVNRSQKRAVDIFATIFHATADSLTNRAERHANSCNVVPDSSFKRSIFTYNF